MKILLSIVNSKTQEIYEVNDLLGNKTFCFNWIPISTKGVLNMTKECARGSLKKTATNLLLNLGALNGQVSNLIPSVVQFQV